MACRKTKPDSLFINITDLSEYLGRSWLIAKQMTEEKGFPKPIKMGVRFYWEKAKVVEYLSKR